MVKVGFIVEGDTEKIILESDVFQNFIKKNKLDVIGIFNAGGKEKLISYNEKLNNFFKIFDDKLTQVIVIICDIENDPCITFTKNSIYKYDENKQIELVSVKAIESWFLADSETFSKIFKKKYYFEFPENTKEKPFDVIKHEFLENTERGISKSGNMLAKKMIKNGFSIENAAKHNNCDSAKYFINKLKEISNQ